MGQSNSTLKESILNKVASGIDDIIRSYELEIKRLTRQIDELKAIENNEQSVDIDEIEEIKDSLDQMISENNILYNMLLSDTNENELRKKLSYLEIYYPDEMLTIKLNILNRLVDSNSIASIAFLVDDLITSIMTENLFKDEWMEQILKFVQEVFDRDPYDELMAENFMECYLPAIKLCTAFFDTPFNQRLRSFLMQNAEVMDSRVLDFNEPESIIELVYCYFVFDMEDNLTLLIKQIIDEWEFIDANISEDEFLKLLWYALFIDEDKQLINNSYESLNFLNSEKPEVRIYEYFHDILGGKEDVSKNHLENLMESVTLFTDYEKVIFLDFLNKKILKIPLEQKTKIHSKPVEPKSIVNKQDDIFIEEVSKLPNKIEGSKHPHLQFTKKEVSLGVYSSKTANNIDHYVKVTVYCLKDEAEYFIVKKQLMRLRVIEEGNWINIVYKSNSNTFKSRERIQLKVQQPAPQKVTNIESNPNNNPVSVKQEEINLNSKSALRDLGYQITGMNRMKRWEVLSKQAVPKLGLKRVVETIAFLVRGRKAMKNGMIRNKHAIEEWEYDLERLRQSYYKHDFIWPKTTI